MFNFYQNQRRQVDSYIFIIAIKHETSKRFINWETDAIYAKKTYHQEVIYEDFNIWSKWCVLFISVLSIEGKERLSTTTKIRVFQPWSVIK